MDNAAWLWEVAVGGCAATAFNKKPAVAVLIDGSCGTVEVVSSFKSCLSSYTTAWFKQAVCVVDSLDVEVASMRSNDDGSCIVDRCSAVEVPVTESYLTLYITTSFSDTAFNYLFNKPAAAVLIDSSCGAVEVATTLNSCMSSYITTWFSDLALNDWFSNPMDNAARLWEVAVGGCAATLEVHSGCVFSVAFSPDSRAVAIGPMDNAAQLCGMAMWACAATLEGHSVCVFSVPFSPDGRTVARIGPMDNTVQLCVVVMWPCAATIEGHSVCVFSVPFSPDGRTVAADSMDNAPRLKDVVTRAATLQGHYGCVFSVKIAASTNSVFLAGSLGATRPEALAMALITCALLCALVVGSIQQGSKTRASMLLLCILFTIQPVSGVFGMSVIEGVMRSASASFVGIFAPVSTAIHAYRQASLDASARSESYEGVDLHIQRRADAIFNALRSIQINSTFRAHVLDGPSKHVMSNAKPSCWSESA